MKLSGESKDLGSVPHPVHTQEDAGAQKDAPYIGLQ